MVDEVRLLPANPQYVHIRHTDGRETTVSIWHLAPSGSPSGNTKALHWHDSPAESGPPSDRGTVVEGANDDHQEHPAEDVPTTITTVEEDTHVPVAPEGLTTPTTTLPTDSTGPATCGDMAIPTRCAALFRHSSRQRRARDRFGYPFECRGK